MNRAPKLGTWEIRSGGQAVFLKATPASLQASPEAQRRLAELGVTLEQYVEKYNAKSSQSQTATDHATGPRGLMRRQSSNASTHGESGQASSQMSHPSRTSSSQPLTEALFSPAAELDEQTGVPEDTVHARPSTSNDRATRRRIAGPTPRGMP